MKLLNKSLLIAINIASLPLFAFAEGNVQEMPTDMAQEEIVVSSDISPEQKAQIEAVYEQTNLNQLMAEKKSIDEEISALDTSAEDYNVKLDELTAKQHALSESIKTAHTQTKEQIQKILTN